VSHNYWSMKRGLDIISSSVGLVMLSPVFLVIAILMKVTSPGPVFYRANRVGQHGQLFKLYKFRSMVANADRTGAKITRAGDPRITTLGRVLRRTKLDELPQLINVLRGEMSLVGPRPEDPKYITYYTIDQRKLLEYRPGITSVASLAFRSEEELLQGDNFEVAYIESILPTKLDAELEYLKHPTLLSDIKVIIQTIFSFLESHTHWS
jgi:lipopolysaccharide/colanic/teichoic acid biosynthesis glycosyltransferase